MTDIKEWRGWRYVRNEEDDGWKFWRQTSWYLDGYETFKIQFVIDIRSKVHYEWPNYIQVLSVSEGYLDIFKVSFRHRYCAVYVKWGESS